MGKPFQNNRWPAFWPAWHTAKNGNSPKFCDCALEKQTVSDNFSS